ncbi:ATP-binding protein [Streptomyces bicolor]|uniref:ATP-binding protein n=1 Tax=Streptomyces bicolor TaxID=66874 RepID=UPI000563F594|nr:AAA family ATPase [Streptomyces bicolor]
MAVDLDPTPPAGGGRGFAFVGRRREAQSLLSALGHPPAVVMIEGEAGVGKTRLVREVTADLVSRGGRVLMGCCHPLREPFPYGPVIDALRQAGPWLPPAVKTSPEAGALAPLLPELADRLPPAPRVEHDPGAERYQLTRAVHAVLKSCGAVTMVIEDLHWVDEATRELLLLLAYELPPDLGLVLTYRREDLSADSPVLGTAYRRPPGTSGVDIHLDPLTEADIHTLAAAALGPRATHTLGRTLYERSAGLPLIVEEDLITLTEQGHHGHLSAAVRDPAAELGQTAVPRGLREAIRTRVRSMSRRALAVSEAAAVLAVPAEEPLLTHVAGLEPEEEGPEALVEALEAAVLRETRPMLYGFRHALDQQAVYEVIPGPRRRRLHERAVTALRDLPNPPLVQIAHHTRAIGDRQAWLTQAEAAAAQALTLGDQGTAATLLYALLAEPHLPGDLRTRAALALSRTAVYSVDSTASVALLRRIITDPQLPTVTRGEIRVGLGLILMTQARDPSGIRELDNAVNEMAGQRPGAASRAMGEVAHFIITFGGSAADALSWMERAERTVQESDDAEARAAVHTDKITVTAQLGDPRVWELVDRLPRDHQDDRVLRQIARALYNAADAALDLGHDERVGPLLDECQDIIRRVGEPQLDSLCRILRQELTWHAGAWEDLEGVYASLAAEYPNHRDLETEGILVVAGLAEARGQWQQAMDMYTSARENAGRYARCSCDAAAGVGRLELVQGKPEAAWAATTPAIDILRRNSAWHISPAVVPVAVQAALAIGQHEIAAQLTTELDHGTEGRDAPAATAYLHLCRGLLTHHTDPGKAREHFLRASATFQAIGRPYPTAQAAEYAARRLVPTNPHQAAEELTALTNAYTRLGATTDAARCHHTLRDLGLARPTPRGRRGYGQQLSPREQQVAQLLATGASNKDIAQALFLSPRTAEHHVARVLKKLNVTDRNDIPQALNAQIP